MSPEMAALVARAERAEALVQGFVDAWGALQLRCMASAVAFYEHLPASWRELLQPPPGLQGGSRAAASGRAAVRRKNRVSL
eukprot:2742062-Alexandrium_andersonii.AAC.1